MDGDYRDDCQAEQKQTHLGHHPNRYTPVTAAAIHYSHNRLAYPASINIPGDAALHCSVAVHQTIDKDLHAPHLSCNFGTALKISCGVLAGFACLGINSKPVTKLHTSHFVPPALTSVPSAHHGHRMQGRSDSCTPVPLHAPDQQVMFPGSDIWQASDQQQQGTVLHLPEQNPRSAGQVGFNTGDLQLQQSSGSSSQQGCGQMSQLFSQADMLEDDLKAYAALVHEQKAVSRYVQPEKFGTLEKPLQRKAIV